jgi:RecA-family ATPase
MQTVARAMKRDGLIGEPLPDVYPSLAQAGIQFRRAGTSLLAGHPGSFKSTFALNMLIKWARKDVTALYISADSDHFTVGKRCAAIITGDPMTTVEKTLREGGYDGQLKKLSGIYWEFRPLDVTQIEERLIAFKQVHGKMPDVIFIDNLMNMISNPTDYSSMMTMVRDLDTLARAASSHVLILHHTHESDQNKNAPARPQAVWELHGRVAQFPRLVLTIAAQQNSEHTEAHLMVACTKNTNGPADRTGREYTDYIIDTASARVSEIPKRH